jgi:hypothetical protein
MGTSHSKKRKNDHDDRVFDTRKMYYDENGNVVYGIIIIACIDTSSMNMLIRQRIIADKDRPLRNMEAEVLKIMEYDALESEVRHLFTYCYPLFH